MTALPQAEVRTGGAQVKLIEKGEKAGGIAAFLGKAVEPPAAAVIANAVASLQTIGALTCPPSPLFLGFFSTLQHANNWPPAHYRALRV